MATALDSLNEDMILTLSEKLKEWDAKLRILTDINEKPSELEDDVHSLKAKKKTETPVLPSITQ